MFKNNLKIAWRNLLKNKYTSAINLIGLVVGMTSAILIWQYVAYEKSYDTFHVQAEDIYRVRTDRAEGAGNIHSPSMQFAAGAACAGPFMKEHFPEVENFVKLYPTGERVHQYQDLSYLEKKTAYVTQSFFDIFSFPLLKGDINTCLSKPFTAVISASQAKKYFGEEDPIGKIMKRSGEYEFEITGIFQDPPSNSHLKFDILLSYVTFSDVFVEDGSSETAAFWDGFLTYLKLRPGTDWQALQAKIPAQVEASFGEDMSRNNSYVNFALQPMPDIYLTSHYLFEPETNGDGRAVSFLLIIGGLVLIIAWFNYINLATARSETRAREVGVRKVIGSSRRNLIQQFMVEAAMINLAAILISLCLVQLITPLFEAFIGKPIPLTIFSEPGLWASVLGIFLLGTFLAGLYPSLVLSSYSPGTALNRQSTRGSGRQASWLRKGLVVGQFALSVILIAGTLVIYLQLQHLQHFELGVDIDQTLVLKTPAMTDSTYQSRYAAFENQVEQLAAVREITGSSSVPGQEFGWTAGGIRRWGAPESESEGVHAMGVDFDFPEFYKMQVVAGRLFDTKMGSDSNACILNEKAVQELHFDSPEAALNVDIDFWNTRLTIVGVVKNFHQQSPKIAFEPLIMRPNNPNSPPGYYSLKMKTNEASATLASIRSIWAEQFIGNPIEYFFLDEHFAKQFESDQRLGSVFGFFSGMAILVSCLGLFALAAFVAERRTKEIGIRKVLGASVEGLVRLLSREFMVLVLMAIVIATPIGYWAMNKWLQDFAHHIELNAWVFMLAGVLAILIALLTVSFQSIKAALANPIQSLRSE